ncbi:hypothetical protein QBC36DRAFT_70546 [Triangularia setosa]|uniref:Uncharacterized protein n=1 Tax=Triangularia setosa TaxID=2587417 RepID=A0AAN6WDK0_9PEZI|nr:hypothetical protein QBC36DRAFT_70546 [Podospora setosa]
MMGSVSSEGTAYLTHRRPGGYAEASKHNSLEHFTHQLQSNVDGRISDACHGRRLFICSPRWAIEEGAEHMNSGLCPSNAEPGNQVALFIGSGALHVIRLVVGVDVDGKPIWGLVGEAYVHSRMNGQPLERMCDPENPEQLRAIEI